MNVDEILFRGKDVVTKEWHYGYYAKAKDYLDKDPVHVIIELECMLYPRNEFSDWDEVDPETVGQYTGRNDMNGNPIFTDDLIECRWRHSADEIDKIARVISDSCIDDGLGRQWPNGTYNCKVIGNIYDNPDIWDKVQEVGREKREKWYKAHEEEMSCSAKN
jgi:hypothetical protein